MRQRWIVEQAYDDNPVANSQLVDGASRTASVAAEGRKRCRCADCDSTPARRAGAG
jgi:hypothetical protein